jgi:peptidoglycan hydrolase-like protein with peptidoglycan-binding domain
MLRLALGCVLSVLCALPALAEGRALIVANAAHDRLRPVRGAAALIAPLPRFEAMGFATDSATDLGIAAMRAAFDAFAEALDAADPRVVLGFAGYIVHADHGVWLLGRDTPRLTLVNVETQGLRLDALLTLAAQRQGSAVVALVDYGFPETLPAGLRPGLPASLTVPQGVSVLTGPAAPLSSALADLAQPGGNIVQIAARRGLRLEGFAPPYLHFLPADLSAAPDPDRRAFEAAQDTDTLDGWRDYLATYPTGAYRAQAEAAIARLENTPDRIEAALNLSRDERRAIQRDLTLLGFNPRGIDGLFGPGTRGAITTWQRREGLEPHGFLNRDQILRLASQAARRAAELEAEARARQAEQDRQDRAFWRDTGAGRDEAALRAYLGRYPDGLFADIARERLAEIDERRRREAAALDRSAWDDAVAADTVAAYRAYLAAYPDGAFAEAASERIAELTAPPPPDLDAARATEDAMNLPQISRLLIERRLAQAGFDPGRVDGVFDDQTRRALRRYQRAADLPVTGYLTEALVSQLLTESIRGLLD